MNCIELDVARLVKLRCLPLSDSLPLVSVPWWTSSRLGLAVIGFFGFVNVYALRVNMSVAIVCMVNGTALELSNPDNKTNVTDEIDSGCLGLKSGTAANSKVGIGYIMRNVPGVDDDWCSYALKR